MNGRRIKSTDNSNDSTEVVQLLKDDHYFEYTRHNSDTLFKVLRLNDTFLQPECELLTPYTQQQHFILLKLELQNYNY